MVYFIQLPKKKKKKDPPMVPSMFWGEWYSSWSHCVMWNKLLINVTKLLSCMTCYCWSKMKKF